MQHVERLTEQVAGVGLRAGHEEDAVDGGGLREVVTTSGPDNMGGASTSTSVPPTSSESNITAHRSDRNAASESAEGGPEVST